MNNKEWHISKTLSIGHLITTLSVAVGLVFYLTDISHATNINSIRIANNDQTIRDLNKSINKTIERIDTKLDKITDLIIQKYGK